MLSKRLLGRVGYPMLFYGPGIFSISRFSQTKRAGRILRPGARKALPDYLLSSPAQFTGNA